jgi:hypothetical protein
VIVGEHDADRRLGRVHGVRASECEVQAAGHTGKLACATVDAQRANAPVGCG